MAVLISRASRVLKRSVVARDQGCSNREGMRFRIPSNNSDWRIDFFRNLDSHWWYNYVQRLFAIELIIDQIFLLGKGSWLSWCVFQQLGMSFLLVKGSLMCVWTVMCKNVIFGKTSNLAYICFVIHKIIMVNNLKWDLHLGHE